MFVNWSEVQIQETPKPVGIINRNDLKLNPVEPENINMFSLKTEISIGSLGVTTTDHKGHSILKKLQKWQQIK